MIVADASPLIHLAKAQRLALLPRLYRRVAIPRSVWEEVVPRDRRLESHMFEEAAKSWLEVRPLSPKAQRTSGRLRDASPIGRGEADAIALAESLKADVLMDDTVAIRIAGMRGLATRWTTSVILEARGAGLLNAREARDAIEDLVRAGLWIRQDVLLRILEVVHATRR